MIMLIQSICMALRGLGRPSSVDRVIKDSAAILLHTHIHTMMTGYNYCNF